MAANSSPNRHWARWIIGGLVALVVLVVGAIVVVNLIQDDPPPPLSVADVTTTTGAGGSTGTGKAAPLAGTWTVSDGSTAGYRVGETLIGQRNTAAGRTNEVSGTITIDGTTVTKADITVDMASVESVGNSIDGAIASRRNDQFRGRIMNTDQFPTATFSLTEPIDLAPVPKDGVEKKYSATGKLTLHGTTKDVTIPLTTKRLGDIIAVQGITTVNFDDYGIGEAAGGPASSVDRSGEFEFLLQLKPS